MDITISFLSHNIYDYPHISSWSLYLLLSNLSRLSIAPSTSLKLQLLTLIIKAFKCRVIDTNEFPFIIDVGLIYHSVVRYESYDGSCVVVISRIYDCYRLFTSLWSLAIVLRSNLMVMVVLNKDTINMTFFNYCGRKFDKYRFYYLCFNILK